MHNISEETVSRMKYDMDQAAKAVWAYPDEKWQMQFQSYWLLKAYGVTWAFGPDGLLWGERD